MKSFLLLFLITNLYSLEIQKPKIYNSSIHNIKNWYMSEKLDGVRAYWNGKELLTKNGNRIYTPKNFTKNFPNFELDGELWTKREDFENIQNIVLDKNPSKNWNEIKYYIFEVPNQKGNFIQRLKIIKNWLKKHPNKNIQIIEQVKCRDEKTLNIFLNQIIKLKGEGVIIKNPSLNYFSNRSDNILKIKTFYDDEGEVIEINYKNSKFKSLKLKLKNGVEFNLGNGFSKEQRLNHPKIGDIVTFKYYDLTKKGKPKFASFLRVRKKE